MARPPAEAPQPRVRAKVGGAGNGGGGAARKVTPGAAPRARGGFRRGLAARAWGGGPSWLGVALIVLSALVLLPIAAAVLGDVWAMLLGAVIGGFALGRATAPGGRG